MCTYRKEKLNPSRGESATRRQSQWRGRQRAEGRGQRAEASGAAEAQRAGRRDVEGHGWNMSGRELAGKETGQGLFSSTLYPGTDLDSPERLAASFLGVAALSLGLARPCSGSSCPSGGPSPSDAWPEELSCRAGAQAFLAFTQVGV